MKRLSLEELKTQRNSENKAISLNLEAIKGGIVVKMDDCHDQCGYDEITGLKLDCD
jgi:hypothetical protein